MVGSFCGSVGSEAVQKAHAMMILEMNCTATIAPVLSTKVIYWQSGSRLFLSAAYCGILCYSSLQALFPGQLASEGDSRLADTLSSQPYGDIKNQSSTNPLLLAVQPQPSLF